MKSPLMLPAYLCGECGIEMLHDMAFSGEGRARERSLILRCYTPRCPQKGVNITVLLQPASVPEEVHAA